MQYVTYDYFTRLYEDEMSVEKFNNLEWEARQIVDAHTTGIDNVRKLRVAFPTDEYDVETVQRCVCKLIKLLLDIEGAEKSRALAQRADGSVTTGVVSSVSSGAESITYATKGDTFIDVAVGDLATRSKMLGDIVRQYLSGVSDANGVCLLYMGVYPYVC